MYRIFFALILLTFARYCYAPAFTIDTPGYYELGDDITFSPGGADAIIVIQASDVELNLGRRIIKQGNATPDVDSYTIDGITFINCQERGLSINTVNNFLIQNCTFTQCAQASTGDAVLFLTNSSFGTIRNSRITTSTFTAAAGTVYGIRSSNISLCTFNDISINQLTVNTAVTLNAITFDGTSTNLIVSNIFIDQLSNTGPAVSGANGITINLTSGQIIFTNCRATNIACTNGIATFLSASSGTTPVSLIGCIASRVSGVTSIPYFLATITNYSLIDCIAQNCTSTTGNVIPFGLSSNTRCNLVRCYALSNSSSAAAHAGISLTVCTGCSVSQCIVADGTAATTAQGYNIGTCTECCYDANGAFRNLGATSLGFIQSASGTCHL